MFWSHYLLFWSNYLLFWLSHCSDHIIYCFDHIIDCSDHIVLITLSIVLITLCIVLITYIVLITSIVLITLSIVLLRSLLRRSPQSRTNIALVPFCLSWRLALYTRSETLGHGSAVPLNTCVKIKHHKTHIKIAGSTVAFSWGRPLTSQHSLFWYHCFDISFLMTG